MNGLYSSLLALQVIKVSVLTLVNLLKSLVENILDGSCLVNGVSCLIADQSNFRLSLCHEFGFFLELLKVRIVCHVLHSLKNTVKDGVKALHDIEALFEILDYRHLVSDLFDIVL